MGQPNLLYVMTDQQRWDALGCSGGWVNTPHLDRLASEGVRFSNCVTTSPICVSARVGLATGRYPHTTGVWSNAHYTLPPDSPTWMRAIRDLGYRTSVFGKTHLHPHHPAGIDLRDRGHLLHDYGLDDVDEIAGPRASAWSMSHMTARWESLGLLEGYRADFEQRFAAKRYVVRPSVLPLEEYADVYVGQQATNYLAQYDRDEPWFCWVSFGGPHEPWDTPEPWASMYRPEDMPEPAPPLAPDPSRPHSSLDRYASYVTPEFEPGEEQRMRADYAGNASLIDDQIGQILAAIEARGELDNTVIVFCSDHGEMNGDHGLIYKMNFFDGAVRVPLIVRTPDTVGTEVAGTVNDSSAEWLDIGPTFVEAAGGELEHRQFGRSLLPALAGAVHRQEAISEFEGEGMLMNDDWKLAVTRRGEPYLLFDRNADPLEEHNLACDPDSRDIWHELKLRMFDRVLESQVQIR
jgi:choline-sulfatase